MERLIYDPENNKVIARIPDCENTCTGTPHQIFEGTTEEVDFKINELGLAEETY